MPAPRCVPGLRRSPRVVRPVGYRHFVYSLTDPRTNVVRYVGRSSSGFKRPISHWGRDLNKRDYCHAWVRSLVSGGLLPEIDVLEEFDKNLPKEELNRRLNDAEIFWIEYLRYIGSPLTNLRSGGLNGYHSEETKRKIGLKSASISNEVREKKRKSMLGKNRGPRPDMIGQLNPNSRENRIAKGLAVRG